MKSRLFMIVTLALPLTACSVSTRSDGERFATEAAKLDKQLVTEKAPAELRRKCDAPVSIPRGALGAGKTERLWRRDRITILNCAASKEALIEFYDDRDARIAAAVK